MGDALRRPTGHVFRVERKRGPVWFAKYRLPEGRQVQKRIGPAWTERGRPSAGYFTKRLAESRAAARERERSDLDGHAVGATIIRGRGRALAVPCPILLSLLLIAQTESRRLALIPTCARGGHASVGASGG
jgi:hypothetical protein